MKDSMNNLMNDGRTKEEILSDMQDKLLALIGLEKLGTLSDDNAKDLLKTFILNQSNGKVHYAISIIIDEKYPRYSEMYQKMLLLK